MERSFLLLTLKQISTHLIPVANIFVFYLLCTDITLMVTPSLFLNHLNFSPLMGVQKHP